MVRAPSVVAADVAGSRVGIDDDDGTLIIGPWDLPAH